MKFPYGIRDFQALITDGYLYIDRTDRIPLVEELGKELLFLRPRRFGKSLWLSLLMNYYDIAKAGDFAQLFGDWAIGQHPTPRRNQYLVMRWDFSEIRSHGSIEQIERALHQHINQWIENFLLYYEARLPEVPFNVRIDRENALNSLHSAVAAAGRSSHKLYLFIDEYDNFANEVMMGSQGQNRQRYDDLMSSEGMFKTLFKNVKSAGSGEGLDRVFMTGVSPIVMNDVTSGANTVEAISWVPELNDLCGFCEDEVTGLLSGLVAEGGLPESKVTETLEQMRLFYDGSCFVYEGESVEETPTGIYNPTLVFYFLKHLQRYGRYPREMLDGNLAPDYNKLVYISGHPAGKDLLLDAIEDQSTEDKAIVSVSTLSERFGMAEMLKPHKQRDRLATLLCYLGALTVDGFTADGENTLAIPNLVMRRLYAERILEQTFPAAEERDIGQAAARRLFAHGDIGPVCEFIDQYYLAVYDNRDARLFNELTVKTLFLALLQYNPLYIMDSEPALLRRYADLIMLIRPEMRHFSIFDLLIEFKHVSLKALKVSSPKLTGQDLRQKTSAELLALAPVKVKVDEARAQLQDYQQALEDKYSDTLKLRMYVVVALGLDRLVSVEI